MAGERAACSSNETVCQVKSWSDGLKGVLLFYFGVVPLSVVLNTIILIVIGVKPDGRTAEL